MRRSGCGGRVSDELGFGFWSGAVVVKFDGRSAGF